MNTLFTTDFWTTYILPSSVSLAVFYLLYKGLVRNDTLLKSRRFLILGFLLFAMVLPFLNFQLPVNTVAFENVGTQNLIPLRNFIYELPVFTVVGDAEVKYASSLPVFNIIGWIYLIVVLLLIGRGVAGALHLVAFSRKGKRTSTEGATIISSTNIPTAFSFFRWIFIPETWYDNERNMALRHERVHVKQKHSWDLILMEVICVVQFFNPFVWLLKREMLLNHEYLADQGTLKNEEDPTQYFQLLLQKIISKQPILAHSLHYSPIKNRIMMQLSKPAKTLGHTRYLAFIPIALLLTFLFACQRNSDLLEDILSPENSATETISVIPKDDGPIHQIVDDAPKFPGGEEARMAFLQGNLRYPAEAREKGIQGTVFVTFVVERDGRITNVEVVRGIGGGVDEEAARVVKNMPNWIPGKHEGETVRVQFMMPIRFTLSG